jgi:hypothetical protein
MEPVLPTLTIGDSVFAFDEKGEVIEADPRSLPHDRIEWENASICDARGGGGPDGHNALVQALLLAERVANLSGYATSRVTRA